MENLFDTVWDRRNTNSLKYDFKTAFGYPEDVLPLWVADMDFPTAQPIREALQQEAARGIFGYSESGEDYYQAVAGWFAAHFSWSPKAQWLVKTPGVVFAIAMAIRAYTKEQDAVLIQPPVYYPFRDLVLQNHRTLVTNELQWIDGQYRIDFADFEEKIVRNNVKLFLFCSPHNPVGRVWTLEELQKLSAICKKHHVLVLSDEIHCDFALPGYRHHVLLEACPELENQTILCTAPSKTFNLAGLQTSNIWIPNPALREQFEKQREASGCFGVNRLGMLACQAAYTHGAAWLRDCKAYLAENLSYLRRFLQEQLPQIRLIEPEGTYFAWLDCAALGLSAKQLRAFMVQEAKLWLDDGVLFSAHCGQFQRMVLACPRAVLVQAMEQLKKAVQNRFSHTG